MVEDLDKNFNKRSYLTEIRDTVRQLKWIEAEDAKFAKQTRLALHMVLVPMKTLFVCFSFVFGLSPLLSLLVSLCHFLEQDSPGGDASGDIVNRAKLKAALDIFYALILFQSYFVFFYVEVNSRIYSSVEKVASQLNKHWGYEEWGLRVVWMYHFRTRRKLQDGEQLDNWNLITYSVELLRSASGDDHLWGARILDKLFDADTSVQQELLSSRDSIQNLIGMIGRRGTADDIESRERAARVLAHLSSDIHVTQFQGTLQCICYLLQNCCKQYCDPQVTHRPSLENNPDEHRLPDKKDLQGSLKISNEQDDAHMVVPVKGQTAHEHEQGVSSSSVRLDKRIINWVRDFVMKTHESRGNFYPMDLQPYKSRGAKELIFQGLLILERLTRDSEENCIEISRHQGLLPKITSPLSSRDFLSKVQDQKMAEMLSMSLAVVSRLLTSPGDGATRLRHELASNTEAVSNLMGMLETKSESKGAKKLHEHALEILTELAFDDSFTNESTGMLIEFDDSITDESTCMINKLFKTMRHIFIEETDVNTIVPEPERESATRVRRKAAESLARLLTFHNARGVNVATEMSKQEVINLLIKALDEIFSSRMGTTADAAIGDGRSNFIAVEIVLESHATDSVQAPPAQENEKQSEERKFIAAMLSLAVVICNENVISKEDFAYYYATPEDAAALATKLKEILQVLKKNSTAECLRIVKLICQVVIAMIKMKPSYIQNFNGHNFHEALAEALETMLDVDDCRLFAGNDREVINQPARSLASLVKEAQELLQTA